jgi:hypothetical protein
VAEGTPTIITEVFSLAQLVYACDTYIGVARATGTRPPFLVSPITGIFSDHLRAVAAREAIDCSPDVIDCAGVALARACQDIVEAREYPVTLLFGGARLPIDFTGLVGARTAATLNYSTVAEIVSLGLDIEDSIHKPVAPEILGELAAKFRDRAARAGHSGR